MSTIHNHHCNQKSHNCSNHNCRPTLTVDDDKRIKVVNYIMSDQTQEFYGMIYYHLDKDQLFFRNKAGLEYPLFLKTRT